MHLLYIIILHSVQNVHVTIKVTSIFIKLWIILQPFSFCHYKLITKSRSVKVNENEIRSPMIFIISSTSHINFSHKRLISPAKFGSQS